MSDNKHHNDPFEKLFRKKAGEYNIQYNEEDWLKLEKKLDIQDAVIARKRKQIWLIAASVLIFSLLGYFTYDNHNRLNQLSRQLPEEPVAGTGQSPSDEEIAVVPGDSADSESETNREPEPENLAEADPQAVQPDPAGDQPEQQQSEPYDRLESPGVDYTETRIISAVSQSILSEEYYSGRIRSITDFRKAENLPPPEALQSENRGIGVDVPAGSENYPVLAVNENSGPPEPARAAISFIVSPDLSTAGSISNFYDPGYKIGFSAEYRISRNLSVSAGALQSKVQYNAPGGQYNPPPYWNGGVTPDEITGVCLLIDIPVTIKYNVLNFDRSRFFATAGISSYIMLNEDYRFNYDSGGAGMVESWNGNTGTRHWLSNAGFSIGYEYDLHSNWSIRAEPFIKVPLKEVGWGNVKLYSIGSFISINYNFL
ncbi:MAG: outer membrane beta-barrel protein [Balneolaceae bacterium]